MTNQIRRSYKNDQSIISWLLRVFETSITDFWLYFRVTK